MGSGSVMGYGLEPENSMGRAFHGSATNCVETNTRTFVSLLVCGTLTKGENTHEGAVALTVQTAPRYLRFLDGPFSPPKLL